MEQCKSLYLRKEEERSYVRLLHVIYAKISETKANF